MKDILKIVVLAVMAGAAPAAAAENPGTGAFAALQLSAGGMDIVMPEARASRVPDPQGTLKRSFDEGSKPEVAGIIGGMAGRAVYDSDPAVAAGVLLACATENNGPLLGTSARCAFRGGIRTRPDAFDVLSYEEVQYTIEMLNSNAVYRVTEGPNELLLRRASGTNVYTIYLRKNGGLLVARHTFVDADGKDISAPAYSYYFKKVLDLK
ncbi:MAG: hypothetical protein WCK76_00830 [Elusimicrobiota bacterium]